MELPYIFKGSSVGFTGPAAAPEVRLYIYEDGLPSGPGEVKFVEDYKPDSTGIWQIGKRIWAQDQFLQVDAVLGLSYYSVLVTDEVHPRDQCRFYAAGEGGLGVRLTSFFHVLINVDMS